MSTLSNKFVAICLVTAISMVMYGCGGGGGGSSPMDNGDNGNGGNGGMTMMCPAGQTGTYPDCMTTEPPYDPAEGERVAKAIGPMATLADNDGTNGTEDLPVNLGDTDAATMDVLSGNTVPESTRDQMNKFAAAEDSPAPITNWMHAKYVRTKEGNPNANPPTDTVMDTFVKYNNKAPNTAQAYVAYFNSNENGSGEAVTAITDATGVLDIDESDVDGNHMLFMGDFGLSAPHQDIPAPTDDSTTANVDEAMVRVMGSFRGVPGTFACDTGCTRSSDEDGNLDGLGGSWTFTPSGTNMNGSATADEVTALMVQGVIPDPDFMMLGYWLQATTNAKGETSYAMRPFTRGNRDFGDVANVDGTATYAGPATGLYMRKVFSVSDDGSSTTVTPVASGQFTAMAMLTATFDQTTDNDIAPNMFNTITGSISDFRDMDGNEIDAMWTVMLTKGVITPADGTFAGEATGSGAFSGLFHGAALTDDATTTDVDESTFAPISASGTFDGHFENGHVRGAFAADRQ